VVYHDFLTKSTIVDDILYLFRNKYIYCTIRTVCNAEKEIIKEILKVIQILQPLAYQFINILEPQLSKSAVIKKYHYELQQNI
jgi:hypothetical protein